MEEIELEEKEKRLGPGGLDPADVFETLPDRMKECFENRDIEALKAVSKYYFVKRQVNMPYYFSIFVKVIAEMEEEEAKYHMKRCVDSGLWVPDAKAAEAKEKSEG